ncbi:hypothetical protein SKAU_G00119490 [Synaphobranchus kaupii]|uniref:Uncharacterized protein n=1 Tax=Synaphobranchus kaupii TaxID=118154 RepID=A0A9Q1FNF4_SYNKA|nr:hypothetical protein SKAU_G00119490 [Synaphobranchus kaupii]
MEKAREIERETLTAAAITCILTARRRGSHDHTTREDSRAQHHWGSPTPTERRGNGTAVFRTERENVRALHCRHVAQPSAVALLSGCAPTRQRPLSYQGPEESKHLRLALAGA